MKFILSRIFNLNGRPHIIRYSSNKCHEYDIVVIGGGIIGTAIAKTIKDKNSNIKVALLEKESELGCHQSSHNSQVIHAGIYYRPNSLKAKLCANGANLIYEYCSFNHIPVKKYGKLIVGNNVLDKIRLQELYKRGLQNNVHGLELLDDWRKIKSIQPNCRGLMALWSPNSGNIDWKMVTTSFSKDFKTLGGDIFLNCEVSSIRESTKPSHPLFITEVKGINTFLSKYAVLCLGLYSGSLLEYDKNSEYKSISLKINYYLLNPKLRRFIKTNIYAMPHVDMPFLGIHFSPTVNGDVLVGPNAVPSLKLDGYNKTSVDFQYVKNHVFSKNFGLLILKNISSCLYQCRERVFCDVRTSEWKKSFPMLSYNDIRPGPTSVQGQLITNDGEFVDDFLIEIFEGRGLQEKITNCRFIPSPGATCSLAIAQLISSEIVNRLNVNI